MVLTHPRGYIWSLNPSVLILCRTTTSCAFFLAAMLWSGTRSLRAALCARICGSQYRHASSIQIVKCTPSWSTYYKSQHGLRVRSDILVYLMIMPLVQTCAFEILRKNWKGEIYVFGPQLIADYHATRGWSIIRVFCQGRTMSLVSQVINYIMCTKLNTGCVSTSGVGLFYFWGVSFSLSMRTLFTKHSVKRERWSPWVIMILGIWFAWWIVNPQIWVATIFRFQRFNAEA